MTPKGLSAQTQVEAPATKVAIVTMIIGMASFTPYYNAEVVGLLRLQP
jgi:hypothetical protein